MANGLIHLRLLSVREAMNQLLEESFVSRRAGHEWRQRGMPLNVSETADAFVVEAVVPA